MPTPPPVPNPPAVDVSAPWRWLALGWRDLWAQPALGLAHGVVLAAFGGLLLWLAQGHFWWSVGAFSGFLIVAPVLAAGLYAVSRLRARGEQPTWQTVWRLWASGDPRMVVFGLLLGAAGTGWVLTSAALIVLWAPVDIAHPIDFFQHVVLAPFPGLFEVWWLLGALLAAPVFASSVITLPMLIDAPVPMRVAVAQSWRAVAVYPLVMVLWASLIVLLVAAGLATAMLGLVVVAPWLGHASWHAYADIKAAGAIAVDPLKVV